MIYLKRKINSLLFLFLFSISFQSIDTYITTPITWVEMNSPRLPVFLLYSVSTYRKSDKHSINPNALFSSYSYSPSSSSLLNRPTVLPSSLLPFLAGF